MAHHLTEALRFPKRTFMATVVKRTDLRLSVERTHDMVARCYHPDGNSTSDVLPKRMAKRQKETEEDVTALTVRVPRTLVGDIDHERKARAVRVPRNTWILEAVVEKLDREKRGLRNGAQQGADDGQE